LYGGIHYRSSVTTAYAQGKKIGYLVMEKLTGEKSSPSNEKFPDKSSGNEKTTASKQ
jgi:hypothetical protein